MRPRRKPFETPWNRDGHRPVTPSILPLVVLLAVAVAMMVALRQEASRLRRQEAGRVAVPRPQAAATVPVQVGGAEEEITIDLSRLSEYEDHARDITPGPFLYLLDLTRRVSVRQLEPMAVSSFTYRDLFERTEEFRGRVLSFRGRVRRIVEVPPGPGQDQPYYEAWVFTADSGHLPYCVISARPPVGLPVARRLNEYCLVVGIFLGWWKHETAGRHLLSSPIVMTPQLLPAPSPVSEQDDVRGLEVTIGLTLGFLILAGLAVVYWLSRAKPASVATPSGVRETDLSFGPDESRRDEAEETDQ